MQSKQKLYISSILLIAFTLKLLTSFVIYPNSKVDDDTYKYIQMGRNPFIHKAPSLPGHESHNGKGLFDKIDSHFPTCVDKHDRPRVCAAPGYPAFLMMIQYFSTSLDFYQLINLISFIQIIVSLISVYLLFKIALNLCSLKSALLASFLFATSPTINISSGEVLTETLSIFLLLLFLYQFQKSARDFSNFKNLYLSGVFLAILLHTKIFAVILLPLVCIFFFFRLKSFSRAYLKYLGVFLLGLSTLTVPWAIRSYIEYDKLVLVKEIPLHHFNFLKKSKSNKVSPKPSISSQSKASVPVINGEAKKVSSPSKYKEVFMVYGSRAFGSSTIKKEDLLSASRLLSTITKKEFWEKFTLYSHYYFILFFFLIGSFHVIRKKCSYLLFIGTIITGTVLIHLSYQTFVRRYLVVIFPLLTIYAAIGIKDTVQILRKKKKS